MYMYISACGINIVYCSYVHTNVTEAYFIAVLFLRHTSIEIIVCVFCYLLVIANLLLVNATAKVAWEDVDVASTSEFAVTFRALTITAGNELTLPSCSTSDTVTVYTHSSKVVTASVAVISAGVLCI